METPDIWTTAIRVPTTFHINALLVCLQAYLLYKKGWYIATPFVVFFL